MMGKYMRKCKGIADFAVMEVAQVGVRTRTRARAASLAVAAEPAAASSGAAKRRKLRNTELNFSSSQYIQLGSRSRVVIAQESSASPAPEGSFRLRTAMASEDECSSSSSDHVSASCCSSNGSSELVKERIKSVDLEESGEVETSTYLSCRERSKTTPSSMPRAESEEVESTARQSEPDSGHRSTVKKKIAEAEINAFFEDAEKDLLKKYSEKYNFDFDKEEPLEGRYEWVKLKP